MLISQRCYGTVSLRFMQAQFFWTIGLALGVVDAMPGPISGLAAGFGVFVTGLFAQMWMERRFKLRTSKSLTAEQSPDTPNLPKGGSAWGGDEPYRTPEGEPVRVLYHSEIAMGGPQVLTYLLDHCVIDGASPSARFSSDGRYFVSPMPSRGAWQLLVFDRAERQLYHCNDERFWELDHVSDTTLYGRCYPRTDDRAFQADIATLLANAKSIPLVQIRDLWVPETEVSELSLEPRVLESHGAQLTAHLWLPESLAALDEPLAPLNRPRDELRIDGHASGLLLAHTDPELVWRSDGQAFVCRTAWARTAECTFWHWEQGRGLRQLAEPWQSLEREPHGGLAGLVALGHDAARLKTSLSTPELSRGDHGTLSSSSPTLTLDFGNDGRAITTEVGSCKLEALLPLDGPGGRSACILESLPARQGRRVSWRWLRDSSDGTLGAYRCRIGDWTLEGEWLIDHRISDCGRYVALVAFADAPAVPSRLAIADLESDVLHWAATPFPGVQLQGFVQQQLHLIYLLGRYDEPEHQPPGQGNPGLLRRFDQPLPPAEHALAFLPLRKASRLYYEQACLVYGDQGWNVRPRLRPIASPPDSLTQGHFIYPAPSRTDSAAAFGFDEELVFPTDDTRVAVSIDGYLLTTSGCGLANIGPAMIWSDDGRYLALTRYVRRHAEAGLAEDEWRLLLLDTQARTLRRYKDGLGCLPRFERFSGRLDYAVESGSSAKPLQPFSLRLAELLQAPAEALHECDGRWLPQGELHRQHYWRRISIDT
ncbi:hypothetical protein GCM10007350_18030 [Jeongeupia chitinilytica]|uniref:Uncharacterized protein n=2 Tax=Jeongeupia chitinilytica TaxID=1041641 RepID=A0ABQ3H166_9NEIS|nr:hypothetical protein GCM10007350_18030 [Jeongeupia chitinilytica]